MSLKVDLIKAIKGYRPDPSHFDSSGSVTLKGAHRLVTAACAGDPELNTMLVNHNKNTDTLEIIRRKDRWIADLTDEARERDTEIANWKRRVTEQAIQLQDADDQNRQLHDLLSDLRNENNALRDQNDALRADIDKLFGVIQTIIELQLP